MSKIIGDMWRSVDDKTKQEYDARYKKDHDKYLKEKEIWEQKYGKIKRKPNKSTEKSREKSAAKSEKSRKK